MEAYRRAVASAVCGGLSLLLPISILAAIGLSRQQLASTPDWVYGTVIGTTLASAIAAVVLGHLAPKGPRHTMAMTGLLLGYGVLVIPALVVASGIAGRLANTPSRTNEAMATGLVPVIQIALEEYRREHGRYPDSLAELVERTAINPDLLRTGRNYGYLYRYEKTADGYRLRAAPEEPGKTGRRAFDVNERSAPRVPETTPPGAR
jgi:hypothetical protein